jgi:SAM-dependent methyltransferase
LQLKGRVREERPCLCGSTSYRILLRGNYDRPLGRDYRFAVAKCLECGLARTLPVPDATQYESGYPQTTREGRFVGDSCDGWSPWVAKYVRDHAVGKRLLDVGCHVGNLVHAAQDQGFRAEGIDIDPVAIAEGSRLGRRVWNKSIEDVYESYDVVVLSHVVEHVIDLGRFLERVSAILVDGGRAFVFAPNYTGLLPRLMKDHWMAWSPSQHVWHFAPKTLTDVVQQVSGLRAVDCTTRRVMEPPSIGIKGGLKAAVTYASRVSGWGDSIEAIFEKPGRNGDAG